jgi:DNA-directed RNA polymerase
MQVQANQVQLEDKQVALEEDMRGMGYAKYIKRRIEGEEVDLRPGAALLDRYLEPVAKEIENWVKDVRSGMARKHAYLANLFEAVGYHACAYTTLRRAINSCGSGQITNTNAAISLGNDINEVVEMRRFEEGARGLYRKVQMQVNKATSERHRKAVLGIAKRRAGIDDLDWSMEERLAIGFTLLELALEASGLFEMNKVKKGKHNTPIYIQPTQQVRQWLNDQHGKCALLYPLYLPMVCKPKPWVSPCEGGYLTIRLNMVKTSKKNNEAIACVEMPTVYEALNAIQETPWRINNRIRVVMEELWNRGGGVAGLPEKEPREVPDKPLDIDTNKEALDAWKHKAEGVYSWNAANLSKRIAIAQAMLVADKFKAEESIYFVHTLDWRGRAYPVATSVHPQGNDMDKSLLEFSEGKPLGNDGAKWLAIHLANTFGYDKVSFEDRLQWVESNAAMILACAREPLMNTEWMEADSPFCFLAACFDWVGYVEEGIEHVSHLPVKVDGSCNGLQHYSAMLLDEAGGKATNLVPSDQPQDIYGLVADEANRLIEEDYQKSLDEDYFVEHEEVGIAEAFIDPQGKGMITRKLTKRNTMTMPYSVSQYGMREQLLEEFHKMQDEGKPWDYKGYDEWECISYLAGVHYKAIRKVVIAAREAMDWLTKVAGMMASAEVLKPRCKQKKLPLNLQISWTTPCGFPVSQFYSEYEKQRYAVTVGGRRHPFGEKPRYHMVRVGTGTIDKKKQKVIAPNFVHSCDSGHMMNTIIKAKEAGIQSLCFIHDSYGTHACDMGELSRLLRVAFVEQYSGDVLGGFRDGVVAQLKEAGCDELAGKVPPVPPKGTLDIREVRDSLYFFA